MNLFCDHRLAAHIFAAMPEGIANFWIPGVGIIAPTMDQLELGSHHANVYHMHAVSG